MAIAPVAPCIRLLPWLLSTKARAARQIACFSARPEMLCVCVSVYSQRVVYRAGICTLRLVRVYDALTLAFFLQSQSPRPCIVQQRVSQSPEEEEEEKKGKDTYVCMYVCVSNRRTRPLHSSPSTHCSRDAQGAALSSQSWTSARILYFFFAALECSQAQSFAIRDACRSQRLRKKKKQPVIHTNTT